MKKTILTILLLFFLSPISYGEETDFTPLTLSAEKDRILILAPHPDDEAIGTAGIIQEALKENIPLKIVYLTNGDNNEPSFIVSQKRIVFRQKAILMMGKLRGQEATNGMGSLGVTKDQLVFLGYPDWGTERIFKSYWLTQKPFKAMLTRVSNVPYKNAFSVGSPYMGESILNDLKEVIEDFKPTKIFVTHPLDTNNDHRAFALYLQVALWDLEGRIPKPEIYGYLIHWGKWPTPRGYHAALALTPPKDWPDKDTNWFSFDLSNESVSKKRKAISFYKSQIGYNPPYLFTFARKNELFANIGTADLNRLTAFNLRPDGSIIYTKDAQSICITLKSDYWDKRTSRMQIFLLGYKRGVPFEWMPKIRVEISTEDNKISVYDKDRYIDVPEAKIEAKPRSKEITIQFPFKNLDNPDYVLTSLNVSTDDLREIGGWRLIQLTPTPIELARKEKIITNTTKSIAQE